MSLDDHSDAMASFSFSLGICPFPYGLTFADTGVEHNRLAGVRISPLALGKGYNGFRDRIFTIGTFYNFDSRLFFHVPGIF